MACRRGGSNMQGGVKVAHLAAARRARRTGRLGGLVAVVHRIVVHHFRRKRIVARDPRLRESRAARVFGERAAFSKTARPELQW